MEKSGNRFFMMVIPNEEDKRGIFDTVPEWFKLDAPVKGWEKRPTTRELQDMLYQNYLQKKSENEGIKQNQTNEFLYTITEDEIDDMSDENNIKTIVIIVIINVVLLLILVLYRKKITRKIEGHRKI